MNFQLFLLLIFALIFNFGYAVEISNESTTNIGVIIDLDSSVGREQKTAMVIALQDFNNSSRNHTLAIHFRNINNDPLHAVSAAGDLIKETRAHVIIGIETWEQAALVANIGKQAQVPILSFASASVTPQLMHHRWPFLIQMGTNHSEQINCVAAIVKSYEWKKVIAIYEDDAFGSDSGMLTLLSDALQTFNAEVEYHLPLPLFSETDSERVIQEEVSKLLTKKSRVFIVLRSSLSLATNLFKIAKKNGLMGRDSVWIVTDPLSSLVDSSNQGVLGIKIHHSDNTIPFLEFKRRFQKMYRSEYPEEDNITPGFKALQAYDSITVVANAVQKIGKLNVEKILLNDFRGISGNIRFQNRMLSGTPVFKIVNFVGSSYKDLGFWSSEYGFQEKWVAQEGFDSMKKLSGLINWPGELNRVPKGWAMPTDAKPMRIGVPGRTSFEKFVKVEIVAETNQTKCDGFCIDLFDEVLNVLEHDYPFPYEFIPFYGSYDALIDQIANKTFDAVVGDVTILANRSKYVEFTQPFAESGLSMLVKVKNKSRRTWMFLKPFTWSMWIATFGILFYTMFVVWFMEHQSNPEFGGPWKDQLGTAMWFTFSSLFFSHREKITSSYTKAVIVVWLFVVFVLTSSYTASLTSMLTVPRLEPSVTDIEYIRKTNASVGCDGDSFVKNYLKNVLDLRNIKNIGNQYDYPEEFNSGNITAAFLELPYKKVFLKEYCKDYTEVGDSYRFGGLGFVFQKGSPIARDVSKAILILSENGKLKRLEDEWFGFPHNCSDTNIVDDMESLSFRSFWALYLVSGITSTICFLVFLVRLLKSSSAKDHDAYQDVVSSDEAIWNKVIKIVSIIGQVQSLNNDRHRLLKRSSTFANTINMVEWRSSQWNLVSPRPKIEIVTTN